MKGRSIISILFAVLVLMFMHAAPASAQEHNTEVQNGHNEDSTENTEFAPGTYILDHIADSHEWHIYTDKHGHHVSVYLPVILYTKDRGLSVFSSSVIYSPILSGFLVR